MSKWKRISDRNRMTIEDVFNMIGGEQVMFEDSVGASPFVMGVGAASLRPTSMLSHSDTLRSPQEFLMISEPREISQPDSNPAIENEVSKLKRAMDVLINSVIVISEVNGIPQREKLISEAVTTAKTLKAVLGTDNEKHL